MLIAFHDSVNKEILVEKGLAPNAIRTTVTTATLTPARMRQMVRDTVEYILSTPGHVLYDGLWDHVNINIREWHGTRESSPGELDIYLTGCTSRQLIVFVTYIT
jgi:hypothetical protein